MADEFDPYSNNQGTIDPALINEYYARLRADPMKLGGGQETAAERALRVGIEAAGGFDLVKAYQAGSRVGPALQRGDTGEAIGSGLLGLGYGVMGMGALAPGGRGARLLAETAPPVRNALRAYHGSPHDFDQFDISKIGIGEGHQAYGRGLYFAEAEPVAQTYRPGVVAHELIGPEGKVIESGSPMRIGLTMGEQLRNVVQPEAKYLGNSIGAVWAAGDELTAENVAKQAWGLGRRTRIGEANPGLPPDWREHAQEAIDRAKPVLDQHRIEKKQMGRMYEVGLNVDPSHLLDWDRPIAEHSEHVRKALGGIGVPERERVLNTTEPLTGRDVIMKLEQEGDPAAAMERLRAAGIKGTRFLDQNSRPRAAMERQLSDWKWQMERTATPGARKLYQDDIDRLEDQLKRMPPPTRNYVIFDDKAIDIVRKYGLAALIGGGAAASGSNGRKLDDTMSAAEAFE